jgi:hypothetical protein
MGIVSAAAAAAPKSPDHLAAFDADANAKAIATALWNDYGDVATVGADEIMDGGYRGKIHLVPQLPIHGYRQQLVWVAAAMKDIDDFFTPLANAKYRWKQLTIQFVRSEKKRTPSAYATDWTITHNVVGSLLTSAAGVRETYFHELFHLNDFDHGDWSSKTLAKDYAAIVKKCGIAVKCLEPYAPNTTKVRASGTYYAFQPNNGDGVHEYAAELAVRYFKEALELRTNGKLTRRAFKCGPVENARAWRSIVAEFFGGDDPVPPC